MSATMTKSISAPAGLIDRIVAFNQVRLEDIHPSRIPPHIQEAFSYLRDQQWNPAEAHRLLRAHFGIQGYWTDFSPPIRRAALFSPDELHHITQLMGAFCLKHRFMQNIRKEDRCAAQQEISPEIEAYIMQRGAFIHLPPTIKTFASKLESAQTDSLQAGRELLLQIFDQENLALRCRLNLKLQNQPRILPEKLLDNSTVHTFSNWLIQLCSQMHIPRSWAILHD